MSPALHAHWLVRLLLPPHSRAQLIKRDRQVVGSYLKLAIANLTGRFRCGSGKVLLEEAGEGAVGELVGALLTGVRTPAKRR